MVNSTGRLNKGGKKEMHLVEFGIAIIGFYGDVMVEGKLCWLGHILQVGLDLG